MDMLRRLAKVLQTFPIKSIFITVIIIVLLAAGVRNVFMATGNDTLVKSSTDVYQDNLMLEEEFGGESIIVLYESDDLLTPESLAHMKGLEEALQTNEQIYSILSPVTLVEEITNKQGQQFKEGIEEMIDGLETMGSKLIEMGTEMNQSAQSNQGLSLPEQDGLEMPDLENGEFPELSEMQLPDLEGQLSELNKGFAQLIDAQENLGNGTQGLVNGYVQFAKKTKGFSETMQVIAGQMDEHPEQAQQLLELSNGLNQLSEQMANISENTAGLPEISTNTVTGLENIQKKLSDQLEEQKQQQEQLQKEQKQMQEEMNNEQEQMQLEIKEQFLEQQNEKEMQMQKFENEMKGNQEEQSKNLNTLAGGLKEMGENLQEISRNTKTMYDYSDIMAPGLPTKQVTLENMIYDDRKLRPVFEEVIVDERHMIMMIKFKGNTSDAAKGETAEVINDYLETEPLDSVQTLASGKPVLDSAIRSSMQKSIQKMMGLALLIMIVVLSIVFKVRWRLLPLLTVLIAVIGTVGLMGWLQIPITMVSMAVFPILIGLGIDYAIQFQNRYTEELTKEDDKAAEEVSNEPR